MKAITQYEYGGPEKLRFEDIEKPTPEEDGVLIEVRAASLNVADWHMMTGTPYMVRLMGTGLRKPKSAKVGKDVAGVVESVGAAVTRFEPGDEVFGEINGSFAEYAVAKEKHLAIKFSDDDEREWRTLCDQLIANALEQPQVFVHRDYHSRNLMVTEDGPGILDFQDAMEGPLTYDLVSLLKDCYVKLSPEQIAEFVAGFAHDAHQLGVHNLDEEQYLRCFDMTGVQRHLKAAGIFARLNHRDGKPGYLSDVPRTLSYVVDLEPHYPELGWLAGFIDANVLPRLEAPA